MTSSHKTSDRRERKKLQTRAALLDAAMALFRERGIYGTRVADITTVADVGKGVFYNYFPTKEALVAELVRQGLELLEREFLMTLSNVLTLEERIDQLVRLHEAFFEKNPEYALLIHQGRGLLLVGDQADKVIHDVFHEYLNRLSRWLPPPSMRTCWDQDSLLDLAAVVAGTVAGYRSFRIAADMPVRIATVSETLLNGITQTMARRRVG